MKITTQGIGIHVGQRLVERIADKLTKFDKYFGDEASFLIKIHPERDVKKLEITMKLQNRMYRAEAKDEEILTAMDRAVDRLESQIRKQKTRIDKQIHDFSYKQIIKKKSFELIPLSQDDAILQMEMLGHSFLVYLDAESGNVCVVYKRKDGNYGLIEPIY